MKKIQLILLIFCIHSFVAKDLLAQSNTVSGGGTATGIDGTITYSVGQVDDIRATGPGGVMLEGVQQPYEIFIVLGIEQTDINLSVTVFPNPTDNIITLSITNSDLHFMSYSLFDVNGRLLASKNIIELQTPIAMKQYASGTYFLKVTNNNKELKNFKIILTQ